MRGNNAQVNFCDFSLSLLSVKMGRQIILLCALLCLTTIINAAPSCKDVAAKYLEDCRAQQSRWIELQNLFRLQECPTLQPGHVDYDKCVQYANRSATYQLISELPEEARNRFSAPFISLRATPIMTAKGPVKMKFPQETGWITNSFNG